MPRPSDVLYDLALRHRELNEWDRVADYAQQFLAEVPPDGAERAVLIGSLLARALVTTGRPQDFLGPYIMLRGHIAAMLDAAARDPQVLNRVASDILHAILLAGDQKNGERCLRQRFPDAEGVSGQAVISPMTHINAWQQHTGASVGAVTAPQDVIVSNGPYSRSYTTDAFSFTIVPNAEILCGWDFIVNDGAVLVGSGALEPSNPLTTWFPHFGVMRLSSLLHLWPADVQYIDADVLVLHGSERFHMGHWIVDFLPRLRALKDPRLAGVKVAVPKELPRRNRDLLALCGWHDSDLIECDLGARYRFRQVVAAPAGNAVQASPEHTRYLAAAFRLGTAEPLSLRLFLMRSMPTRRIVNMPEVRRTLELFGFDFVTLAETEIAAQRSLLWQAEIVVCMYGSDPLSALFMQPGADMIELNYVVGEGPLDSGAGAITTLVDINYHVLFCTKNAKNPGLRKNFDVAVDCEALKRMVDGIIDRQEAGQSRNTPFNAEIRLTSRVATATTM